MQVSKATNSMTCSLMIPLYSINIWRKMLSVISEITEYRWNIDRKYDGLYIMVLLCEANKVGIQLIDNHTVFSLGLQINISFLPSSLPFLPISFFSLLFSFLPSTIPFFLLYFFLLFLSYLLPSLLPSFLFSSFVPTLIPSFLPY